jgi:hypothetical protein
MRGSLWRLPGRRLSLIMTELMRWHLRNHNCNQILLGISHDAGYAPFLDEVVTADERSRIAIIQGPPTVRELSATGLQIIDFKQIFRQEKLVNRTLSNTSLTLPSTWAGITSNSPSKNGASVKQPVPTTSPVWNPGPRGLDDPITLPPWIRSGAEPTITNYATTTTYAVLVSKTIAPLNTTWWTSRTKRSTQSRTWRG